GVVFSVAVLPAGFGCDGKHGDQDAILRGSQLHVVADETDEGNTVLIHVGISLFLPRFYRKALEAGGACPLDSAPHLRGRRGECRAERKSVSLFGTSPTGGRVAE